jgi:hypothetical protein
MKGLLSAAAVFTKPSVASGAAKEAFNSDNSRAAFTSLIYALDGLCGTAASATLHFILARHALDGVFW